MNDLSFASLDQHNPLQGQFPLIARSLISRAMEHVAILTQGMPPENVWEESKAFWSAATEHFHAVEDLNKADSFARNLSVTELFDIANDVNPGFELLHALGLTANPSSQFVTTATEATTAEGHPKTMAYLLVIFIAAAKETEVHCLQTNKPYAEIMEALDDWVSVIAQMVSLIDAMPTGFAYMEKVINRKAGGSKGGQTKAKRWSELKAVVKEEYLARYANLSNAKAAREIDKVLPETYKCDDSGKPLSEDLTKTIERWIPKIKKGATF